MAVIVEQLALGGKRERRLFLNMLRQFVEGDWAGERARAEAREALGLFSEKGVLKRAFPREAANAGRKKAATDTEEFRRWFGKSVVARRDGKPLMVYHGTLQEFERFERGDIGFHFGSKVQANRRVDDLIEELREKGGQVGAGAGVLMPVYLRLENPLYLSGDPLFWSSGKLVDMLRASRREGYGELADALEHSLGEMVAAYREPSVPQKEREALWRAEQARRLGRVRAVIQAFGYDGVIYRNNFERGLNLSQIAAEAGVSRLTLRRWIKRLDISGLKKQRYGGVSTKKRKEPPPAQKE